MQRQVPWPAGRVHSKVGVSELNRTGCYSYVAARAGSDLLAAVWAASCSVGVVPTAAALRHRLTDQRRRAARQHHLDGHPVGLRAQPDYDALFGVEFDCTCNK